MQNEPQRAGLHHRYRWIIFTVVACLLAIRGSLRREHHGPLRSRKAAANSRTVPVVTATVKNTPPDLAPSKPPASSSLGSAWDATVPATNGMDPIVTAAHLGAGSALTSGGLIANVAGRPVIALAMPFAFYRDIHGGDTGDGVAAASNARLRILVYTPARSTANTRPEPPQLSRCSMKG